MVQRTLHLHSQLIGDSQECGHGDNYQVIVEDLQTRFCLSKKQARDRLAALKIQASQSIHNQGTEVTRIVKVEFPALADADQRAMATAQNQFLFILNVN